MIIGRRLLLSSRLFGRATTTSRHHQIMPSLPLRYQSKQTLDLSALQLNELHEQREQAFAVSRQMKTSLHKISELVGTPECTDEIHNFQQTYQEHFPETIDRTPRPANLSFVVEEYLAIVAFDWFLQTGTLLSPSPNATDEEYLAGAVMGLIQKLQEYGLGMATNRDTASLRLSKDLVEQLLNYLLEFDFRNGPLRRKYDGCKYSLRALETFLYELAVTSSSSNGQQQPEEDPAQKKQKTDDDLLPMQQLQELKSRMHERDELRETLIKNCRDGQKAAKQAIFALHRNDIKRCETLLKDCEACITDKLLPTIQQEPSLRFGSFASVMEEYVEARLYFVWLQGCKEGAKAGMVLNYQDFDENFQLAPDEYLGGICDLTGEIGRYAVQRGTSRDVEAVRECLSTNLCIRNALQSIENLPRNIEKKMSMVQTSVTKLERILYELMLSEAAGGRNIIAHDDDHENNTDDAQ